MVEVVAVGVDDGGAASYDRQVEVDHDARRSEHHRLLDSSDHQRNHHAGVDADGEGVHEEAVHAGLVVHGDVREAVRVGDLGVRVVVVVPWVDHHEMVVPEEDHGCIHSHGGVGVHVVGRGHEAVRGHVLHGTLLVCLRLLHSSPLDKEDG